MVTCSVNEIVGEAEKTALVAMEDALAAPKDDASGKKVFNELEGVDKAVTTACSGVIRTLLQVCLASLFFSPLWSSHIFFRCSARVSTEKTDWTYCPALAISVRSK